MDVLTIIIIEIILIMVIQEWMLQDITQITIGQILLETTQTTIVIEIIIAIEVIQVAWEVAQQEWPQEALLVDIWVCQDKN